MRIIYADALTELVLGKQGENEAQKIVFPKHLFQEFGDGEYGLIAQREGDENPYPCVITEDERNVYWIISSSDVAYAGYGNCELRLTIGDQIVKSITWTTKVFECMGESGEAPEPYESWVQEVLNAKAAIDNMSASASVDNNVGVPSVTVTKETIGDHNNFDFAFKNLKGVKGDQGNKGDTGDTGNGIESVTLNADYTLTIRYTSGQTVTTAPIRGEKGDTGNGISSITFNPDYSLTIHCTDGTSYTTSSIRGETGATGNGIASIVLNSNYTLTINYTDGTHYTTTSIRGEKGAKGNTGDTGNGISSAVLNDDYTLTLTFTDGTSYTTPSIRGEQGEQGEPGEVTEAELQAGLLTRASYESVAAVDHRVDNIAELLKGKDYVLQDGTSPAYEQTIGAGTQKYAELGMLGGKSVLWNQLIKNGNMTSTGNWAKQPATTSISIDTDNNILTFTMPANNTGGKRIYEIMQESIPAGHKVLMRFDIKTDGYNIALRYGISNSSTLGSGSASVLVASSTIAGATDWTTIVDFFERDIDCDVFVLGSLSGTGASPVVWQIRRVNLFDLTAMFGAGNEPTTYSQFTKMFKDVYYETSSFIIKSGKCDKIVSANDLEETIAEYEIPAAVQSLEGYGESNGDTYNYIDFVQKKFYEYGHYVGNDWTALDEPIETDISAYLSDDGFIETSVGGTVSFHQPDGNTILLPNKVTYMIKLEEAI